MNEKILVVDDEPDMLKLLEMVLTSYNLTTTNNPIEALELAKKGGYDVVITDLKMPGLDGIELLKSIRQFDENIPIIIITAYATNEAASESMEKNAFDFITKPFRKEQIIFAIEKAIKWIRTQKENIKLKEQIQGTK
jgi:DNA-binding NtrC family response regulator